MVHITSFKVCGFPAWVDKAATPSWYRAWMQGIRLVLRQTQQELRLDLKMNQRSFDRSACPWSLRAHLPLCPQWPRLNSIRGPKCRNRSPLGQPINPPSCGVLSGVAALVTSATGDEAASQQLPICAGPGPSQILAVDRFNLRSSSDQQGPTGLTPRGTSPCIASEGLALLKLQSLWTLWTAVHVIGVMGKQTDVPEHIAVTERGFRTMQISRR